MENRIATILNFELNRDSFGRLVLTLPDGARHVGVTAIRGFPISDPQHGISISNSEGREVMWIEDLAELPSSVREILETQLKESEFLPEIRRLVRVSVQTDPCQWDVITDRGPTTFLLKTEDDVRPLGEHRALVTDSHGVRYLIADTTALDRHSRRILERYL